MNIDYPDRLFEMLMQQMLTHKFLILILKIFDGASWFHTTGITPALSDKATALSCINIAKAKGVTTSIDLNYRKKLWSKEKAKEV